MNMRYAMRSEDTEQINVVSWANWNMNRYPELKWLHHVPNGGSRNKQEAVKLKQIYDGELVEQDNNENTVHGRVQIHGVLVQRRSEFELAGSV